MTSRLSDPRKQIYLFITLTFLFSWVGMGCAIAQGPQVARQFLFAVMWVPGILGWILSRMGPAEERKDLAWRKASWHYWLLGLAVPFFVALLSYKLSWMTGISSYESLPMEELMRNQVQTPSELVLVVFPWVFVFGFIGALGEEIGWRGYMLPKMYRAGWRRPLLASSLVWGAWHIPAILWGGYATSDWPLISVVLFLLMISLAGAFAGWLRMHSQSIWPVTLFHACHNFFLITVFASFDRAGPWSPYLGGESGLFTSLAYAMILYLGWSWLKRQPRSN